MSYLKPDAVVENMIKSGMAKSQLPVKDIMIRGILCGALLAYATSFAYFAEIQTKPIVGAILFPVGFVLIILLGMEMLTGNFALVPSAYLDGKCSFGMLLRSWTLAFTANLIGSVIYGVMFAAVLKTHFNNPALIQKMIAVAEAKTSYWHMGPIGLAVAFMSAMLCNWMVTLGTIIPYSSTTTTGKIVAMWLPIMTFFGLGYEHSVVNMFVIPTGMMLGANVSFSQWWIWNQLPVTLGNIVGGAIFTASALYFTHAKKKEEGAVIEPAAFGKSAEKI